MIDDAVIDQIEDCIDLAPLHNPANLKGIYAAARAARPGRAAGRRCSTPRSTPRCPRSRTCTPSRTRSTCATGSGATASTAPRTATSRTATASSPARRSRTTNIITIHLGNGCSACAIQKGESIDTSMGLTPLEGLVMGTRGGDIDPSVLEFLHHKEGLSFNEIDALLNKQSGLLGVSGLTNDMRELLEEERVHQDRRARLAIDIFCLRVKQYIGSYLAQMNGADAIVFTGGIGENSPEVRARICRDLDFFGICLDEARNDGRGRRQGGRRRPRTARARARLRHPDERGAADRARHRALRAERAAPLVGSRPQTFSALNAPRNGAAW